MFYVNVSYCMLLFLLNISFLYILIKGSSDLQKTAFDKYSVNIYGMAIRAGQTVTRGVM